MDIKRINTYDDPRFSRTVLNQHGCFLVDGEPYEVEILSDTEAVIRGGALASYDALIEEFRFYTPHICVFYDESKKVIGTFPKPEIIKIALEDVQPSQFYVDRSKVAAVGAFIRCADDIIIQVKKHGKRYISLDGHTRLFFAAQRGYPYVRAVLAETDDFIYDFADEAVRRNIRTPKDLVLLCHEEYAEKWDSYCDAYFAQKQGG